MKLASPYRNLKCGARIESGWLFRIVGIILLASPTSHALFAQAEIAGVPDRTVAADNEELEIEEPEITESDRDHWSFKPLLRPSTPRVKNHAWPINSVDHFVLARLEANRLSPLQSASRTTLIRRLYLNLVGLPPSPPQIDRFINDPSPDAYERLVDRLLSSPQYGERWGQHWLDLARFAETDGFEHDKVRPTAWKYRDWVVRALNADMPFDRFTRLQIAGDLLEPQDADAKLATAFCCSGPDMPDINSQDERKHTLLNEMTSTVGSVFMGLTVGCAQCHDHMYDPISQADFYRLRAFFDPAVKLKRNESVTILDSNRSAKSPAASHLFIRGDWRRKGAMLTPDFLRVLHDSKMEEIKTARATKHRADLARWLTDRRHPLTSRVFVNRIWQYHFGTGLSGTPSDFGVMGTKPSHPELLDWLAFEFVERGWQIKSLHRLIVTSSTFRQKSFATTDDTEFSSLKHNVEDDPNNQWLSRYPRRRLDAEVIRDCMYNASGSLNLRMGGSGVRPPLPREMTKTLLHKQWEPSPEQVDHYRRSIYIFARRNFRYPIFAAFDRPAANSSCATRQVSTIAPQALLMLNSEVTLDAARRLAKSIRDEEGKADRQQQVIACYRRTLGRLPSALETQEAVRFLEVENLIGFCLALLNSSEFLYVD